jgi:hypothetical protein
MLAGAWQDEPERAIATQDGLERAQTRDFRNGEAGILPVFGYALQSSHGLLS